MKVVAYADDLLVFLGRQADAQLLKAVMQLCADGYGLAVSATKSTYYAVGGSTVRPDFGRPVDPDDGDMFLGVPIGPRQDEVG